jgi:hypothetical protein
MARRQGWRDCEIFGNGEMITGPQEARGWKLIPADTYESAIPAEAARRVLQMINSGVRIQGVIIADDQRRKAPPLSAPASPRKSLAWVRPLAARVGKTLLGLIGAAALLAVLAGFVYVLVMAPLLVIGLMLLGCFAGTNFDPKLVILVDDGNGGSSWISLFTWYD